MELSNRCRILRRLAGRIRSDAVKIDDKAIAIKLVLMATELELLVEQQRNPGGRRS